MKLLSFFLTSKFVSKNLIMREKKTCVMSHVPCANRQAIERERMHPTFGVLNDDVVIHIAGFVSKKSYLIFALVNKRLSHIYNHHGLQKETSIQHYVRSPENAVLLWNECREYSAERYLSFLKGISSAIVDDKNQNVLRWAMGTNDPIVLKTVANKAALCNDRKVLIDTLYKVYHNQERIFDSIALYSVKGNNFSILQWAYYNKLGSSGSVFAEALKTGNIFFIKWMNTKQYSWPHDPCYIAAFHGHAHVLEWLRDQGCFWDATTFAGAAEGGNWDLFKFLFKHKEPDSTFDQRPGYAAAATGKLDILQWLQSQGCVFDENTSSTAARFGKLDVLKWLKINHCPWDEETCVSAAGAGNLHVLQWAYDNSCPWDSKSIVKSARIGGHSHVLEWILSFDHET